jgi:uncharacterized membrane protein
MSSGERISPLIRRHLLLSGLFFAAWLLPRFPAVRANVLMRDDFVHEPAGHLLSYRPLFFLDLLFWNRLIGPEYLRTVWPKLIAGFWIASIALITFFLLRRWRYSSIFSAAIVLLFVAHPVVNDFSTSNIFAAVPLSMLLAVAAYRVSLRGGALSSVGATALLLLSISGYQINLAVFLMLALAGEMICIAGREGWRPTRLVRPLSIVIAAVLLYGAYILVSVHLLGIRSWGGRGFAVPSLAYDARFLDEKWHAMSNMMADVAQPLLSYFFNIGVAWRYWSVPFLIVAGVVVVSAIRTRRIALLMVAGGIPLIPATAAMLLLGMSWTPEGWRVCGPAVYGFAISIAVAGRALREAFPARALLAERVVSCLLLIAITGAMIVTRRDAAIRVESNLRDEAAVAQIKRHWRDRSVDPATTLVQMEPRDRATLADPAGERFSRGIIAEFRPVTWLMYSNIWSSFCFPDAFFRFHGLGTAVSEPPPWRPDAATRCSAGSRPQILFDDAALVAIVCR